MKLGFGGFRNKVYRLSCLLLALILSMMITTCTSQEEITRKRIEASLNSSPSLQNVIPEVCSAIKEDPQEVGSYQGNSNYWNQTFLLPLYAAIRSNGQEKTVAAFLENRQCACSLALLVLSDVREECISRSSMYCVRIPSAGGISVPANQQGGSYQEGISPLLANPKFLPMPADGYVELRTEEIQTLKDISTIGFNYLEGRRSCM